MCFRFFVLQIASANDCNFLDVGRALWESASKRLSSLDKAIPVARLLVHNGCDHIEVKIVIHAFSPSVFTTNPRNSSRRSSAFL